MRHPRILLKQIYCAIVTHPPPTKLTFSSLFSGVPSKKGFKIVGVFTDIPQPPFITPFITLRLLQDLDL
jgi:hypothetical protein